jgi:predicted trehalose synthase
VKKLHRPECPIRTEDAICCSIACICGTLQACEDRVAAAFHQIRKDDRKEWERFARDQFDAGYADGLNAAREAVEVRSHEALHGGP